jgi:hypothetical protein
MSGGRAGHRHLPVSGQPEAYRGEGGLACSAGPVVTAPRRAISAAVSAQSSLPRPASDPPVSSIFLAHNAAQIRMAVMETI